MSCKELNRKVAVTSVAVNPTEKTLKVGEEFVIAPIVSPENASDKTMLWSSNNPNVATVSVDGRVSEIIGNAEVNKKLTVKAHKISTAAKESIEKAGGSVEILEVKSYSAKAGNNKKEDENK